MSTIGKAVKITLDRERALECDFNAIDRMDREAGVNLLLGQNPLEDRSPAKMKAVLSILLSNDDPAITPETAGKLINGSNLTAVMEKIVEAIAAFFPEPESVDPPLKQPESR